MWHIWTKNNKLSESIFTLPSVIRLIFLLLHELYSVRLVVRHKATNHLAVFLLGYIWKNPLYVIYVVWHKGYVLKAHLLQLGQSSLIQLFINQQKRAKIGANFHHFSVFRRFVCCVSHTLALVQSFVRFAVLRPLLWCTGRVHCLNREFGLG